VKSRPEDLIACFDRLPSPDSDIGAGRYCVLPIDGCASCFIGKDSSGGPALLIATDRDDSHAFGAPLVLEWLRVVHMVQCRVHETPTHEVTRRFSVVHCNATDRQLQVYFLRSLHPIIASLPNQPQREDVTKAVMALVELFSRLHSEPTHTVLGLWAELFVIASASDPETLIRAWHAIPEERYDFSIGPDRLEVKAASAERVHHFHLSQLRPTGPTRVRIASLLTERSHGGAGITDLVDAIRGRVASPDLLVRLDGVIAETLGREWGPSQDVRFDREHAIATLRFIDARAVPAVVTPLPPEVSDVHFRVDITQYADTPLDQHLTRASELFAAALPNVQSPR
jgi:hypothetical protein